MLQSVAKCFISAKVIQNSLLAKKNRKFIQIVLKFFEKSRIFFEGKEKEKETLRLFCVGFCLRLFFSPQNTNAQTCAPNEGVLWNKREQEEYSERDKEKEKNTLVQLIKSRNRILFAVVEISYKQYTQTRIHKRIWFIF